MSGDPGSYPPEPDLARARPRRPSRPPHHRPGHPAPAGYPPAGGYPPPTGDQPPSGGYPPPGGYPPGSRRLPDRWRATAAPAGGYANTEDKTWALVAHFGGAVGTLVSGGPLGFIAPLIAMLAKGNESPTVRAHAVAALNFQLTWSIVAFVLLSRAAACLLFLALHRVVGDP